MFVEACVFFVKVFLILMGYLCSYTVVFVVEKFKKWRNRKEHDEKMKQYKLVLSDPKMQIDKADVNSKEICILCMENYQFADEITRLPCNCRHFFHSKCIEAWINDNPICPYCNQEINVEE